MSGDVALLALAAVIVSLFVVAWSLQQISKGRDWPIILVNFFISPLLALAVFLNVAAANSVDQAAPSFQGLTLVYAEWVGASSVVVLLGLLGRLNRAWPLGSQLVATSGFSVIFLVAQGQTASGLPLVVIVIMCMLGLLALRWRRSA